MFAKTPVSTQNLNVTRLWNPYFIMIMVVNFGANVSFYLISSILSTYSIQLGASQALSGIIVGCFSIVALVARPFSGVISNRGRSSSLLVFSFLGMAFAALGYAFAPRPILFLPIRVLHGIAFSINGVVTMVLVSKVLPEAVLTKGMAYFGVSQVLAAAVGPTVGSACGQAFGYRYSFIVAAATLIVFCIVVFVLPIPQVKASAAVEKKRVSLNELLDVRLIRLVAFSALFSAFNGLCSSYMVNIGAVRGIDQISLYFTVNSASIILVRFLCGRLADKIKSIHYIMLCTLLTACLGCVIIGAANALWLFFIGAFIQAFSHGFAQPAVQAESLKQADPSRLGTSSSTFFISADLGQGLGVMIGGAVAGVAGYDGMFYVMAVIFLLAIPLYALVNMGARKKVSKTA
ncbi:MAG TPA: MFS transporter [Candidatus Excrementavichristensenella intestinipullorum]|nr:MFS transporter [Candidatus Excrementavichristensenella intestinipullorum]